MPSYSTDWCKYLTNSRLARIRFLPQTLNICVQRLHRITKRLSATKETSLDNEKTVFLRRALVAKQIKRHGYALLASEPLVLFIVMSELGWLTLSEDKFPITDWKVKGVDTKA